LIAPATQLPRRLRRRLPRTFRRGLVAGAASFGLMLALRGWLQWIGPLPGDRYAVVHFSVVDPDLPRLIIDVYLLIAQPWFVLLTLVLALAALGRYAGMRAALGLVLAEFVIVWNMALKAIFGPTPLWSSLHSGGVNYPSGHVSYVTAVVGYLAWTGFRQRRSAVVPICLIVIGGMGIERVLSGTHLPSDVVGGYLLGLSWVIPVTAWTAVGWTAAPPGRPAPGSGPGPRR
jgi:membrane-associated phospholipid phosphatase